MRHRQKELLIAGIVAGTSAVACVIILAIFGRLVGAW